VDRDRVVELVVRLFAGLLFGISVLGLVFALRDGEGIVTPLFAVYLTGVLLGGVLWNATRTPVWQLTFFGGVALWGGWEYAATGDWFSLLLAVIGVLMVVANLLNLR
jgi:hypothetical protein